MLDQKTLNDTLETLRSISERTDTALGEIYEKLTEIADFLDKLDALEQKIDDHDCWECQENSTTEYVEIVNRDHPKFHRAVEQNYTAPRKMTERLVGHPTPCQTIGCDGTLWAEYIEEERYLVKCSNNCRIIWTWADSPVRALENSGRYTPEN